MSAGGKRARRARAWGGARLLTLAALAVGAGNAAFAAAQELWLTDPASGREVRVDGNATVLHLAFFATWCPDCLDELARLGDYVDRFGERGYRLVLVAVPERQTAERLQAFVASNRPPGRLLLDAAGKLGARLKVSRVPTHLLLDGAGNELGRFDDAAAAAAAIERGLGQSRPEGGGG